MIILKVNLSNKYGEDYTIYYLYTANNFLKRASGLMLRKLKDNEGMIFYYNRRKIHIHTFFMRFPIDVIFLWNNEIVDIVRNLKPWRVYKSKVHSNTMIEIKSNNKLNLRIGDIIEIYES